MLTSQVYIHSHELPIHLYGELMQGDFNEICDPI
jgi:hypothetical protein